MTNLTGMEKFSHLEDKIYLTIEFVKKLREEKERLERENAMLRQGSTGGTEAFDEERKRLEKKIEALMAERDVVQLKVEAMLEAITILEPEVAEVLKK